MFWQSLKDRKSHAFWLVLIKYDAKLIDVTEPERKLERKIASKRKSTLKRVDTLKTITEENDKNVNLNEDDDVFPAENPPQSLPPKTLRRVQDSVRNFEELENQQKDLASRDQVILRTRAHRNDFVKPKRRISSTDSIADAGYAPLNEKTRAWILAGAKNNENLLRSLLNECPKIFGTRDPATGYTALHWAAKYGNESLIHLLIGRYRMDVNIKTRGGYTPLMISAMHHKHTVYQLLLNTYGSNPNIRDFSGRKAEHYYVPLDDIENEDSGVIGDQLDGKLFRNQSRRRDHYRRGIDRSATFIREFIRDSTRKPRYHTGTL